MLAPGTLRTETGYLPNKKEKKILSETVFGELLRAVLHSETGFRFQAGGFSMSLFIKNKDVITVYPYSRASPAIGDVVACFHPETKKIVVHRIVAKNGDAYLLKGDNIEKADGMVPAASILGAVRKVERNGKTVSLGLGPERAIIAFMARKRFLIPLINLVWRLARPILRRKAK